MLTKEDVAVHNGLMKLLDEATFPLKAREVRSFLVIYDWAKNMPARLAERKDAATSPEIIQKVNQKDKSGRIK
jgi:hypothetical protein